MLSSYCRLASLMFTLPTMSKYADQGHQAQQRGWRLFRAQWSQHNLNTLNDVPWRTRLLPSSSNHGGGRQPTLSMPGPKPPVRQTRRRPAITSPITIRVTSKIYVFKWPHSRGFSEYNLDHGGIEGSADAIPPENVKMTTVCSNPGQPKVDTATEETTREDKMAAIAGTCHQCHTAAMVIDPAWPPPPLSIYFATTSWTCFCCRVYINTACAILQQ